MKELITNYLLHVVPWNSKNLFDWQLIMLAWSGSGLTLPTRGWLHVSIRMFDGDFRRLWCSCHESSGGRFISIRMKIICSTDACGKFNPYFKLISWLQMSELAGINENDADDNRVWVCLLHSIIMQQLTGCCELICLGTPTGGFYSML